MTKVTLQKYFHYAFVIILKNAYKQFINGYFSIDELSIYGNSSANYTELQIKKGRYVLVLKKEIIKLIGKPNITPIKNG